MSDSLVAEGSKLQEKRIEHQLSASVSATRPLKKAPLTKLSTCQKDPLDDVEASVIHDIHHGSLNPRTNALQRWAYRLEALAGVEARGIERVPESLRAKNTTFGDYGTLKPPQPPPSRLLLAN